jgi:hypothetical protein
MSAWDAVSGVLEASEDELQTSNGSLIISILSSELRDQARHLGSLHLVSIVPQPGSNTYALIVTRPRLTERTKNEGGQSEE